MSAPGTFERVYAALGERLRQGVYRPGERLEPAALSDELNASVTPVRDALHRPTGERLVEAPRHEGFRVPMMTESTLRHLYAWHRDLLLLALLTRRREMPEAGVERSDAANERERQNALFFSLARLTGNPEHLAALQELTGRIAAVQKLEPALLDCLEQETAAIAAAMAGKDRRQLRRTLLAYHRRRWRIVPELIERLQSGRL
jgi:DNA-binding GntR family transcriptional regulator